MIKGRGPPLSSCPCAPLPRTHSESQVRHFPITRARYLMPGMCRWCVRLAVEEGERFREARDAPRWRSPRRGGGRRPGGWGTQGFFCANRMHIVRTRGSTHARPQWTFHRPRRVRFRCLSASLVPRSLLRPRASLCVRPHTTRNPSPPRRRRMRPALRGEILWSPHAAPATTETRAPPQTAV